MHTFDCEITDTFGGQANYSWVRRATFELPDNCSDRSVVIAAKAALGITGVPCRTFRYGDSWELRVRGACEVAFISARY